MRYAAPPRKSIVRLGGDGHKKGASSIVPSRKPRLETKPVLMMRGMGIVVSTSARHMVKKASSRSNKTTATHNVSYTSPTSIFSLTKNNQENNLVDGPLTARERLQKKWRQHDKQQKTKKTSNANPSATARFQTVSVSTPPKPEKVIDPKRKRFIPFGRRGHPTYEECQAVSSSRSPGTKYKVGGRR